KGARPYHQAYERGVKTVGATAHYVSGDLDEGPIISQTVQEVDHAFGPEELVAAGRDTECKALSNAVRWHCEGRVFLHGNRTVVRRCPPSSHRGVGGSPGRSPGSGCRKLRPASSPWCPRVGDGSRVRTAARGPRRQRAGAGSLPS